MTKVSWVPGNMTAKSDYLELNAEMHSVASFKKLQSVMSGRAPDVGQSSLRASHLSSLGWGPYCAGLT